VDGFEGDDTDVLEVRGTVGDIEERGRHAMMMKPEKRL
jgi:hypothetical protein